MKFLVAWLRRSLGPSKFVVSRVKGNSTHLKKLATGASRYFGRFTRLSTVADLATIAERLCLASTMSRHRRLLMNWTPAKWCVRPLLAHSRRRKVRSERDDHRGARPVRNTRPPKIEWQSITDAYRRSTQGASTFSGPIVTLVVEHDGAASDPAGDANASSCLAACAGGVGPTPSWQVAAILGLVPCSLDEGA
jgi:hypothetical protein